MKNAALQSKRVHEGSTKECQNFKKKQLKTCAQQHTYCIHGLYR